MYSKDEARLIKKCLNGNRNAMQQLILNYQKPVFNAAYRLVGDKEDATEITQQTFLKVIEKLHQYDPKYKFFSWLYRIAINESIDFIRKSQYQSVDAETLEATSLCPDGSFTQSRMQANVQAVLMQLKDDYRTVIVLKYFVGCNYKEISDVLDIPIKMVKSRLYTARQEMKNALQNAGVTLR